MSLFLNNHSLTHIMILGRWRVIAFMAYIREESLEWTSNISNDMIKIKHVLDLRINEQDCLKNLITREDLDTVSSLLDIEEAKIPRMNTAF